MVNVILRETYGSDDSSERLYVQNEDQNNSLTVVDKQSHRWLTFSSIKMFFTSVFLPSGYPESVSNDYLEYQMWDSIQAFASSIMNNLGTHAILKGVGVGDSSATVLAATITWLLRDGTSMTGRIIFAYIQSSKLDSDCKKWRLFADLINDISIFIDLLSPYFSNYFLYMQCFSGVLKSLVGTAGGATRAALTQHQARRNNMADVSAKDGSQETLVNLTALFCSLIIVPIVANNSNFVWLLFLSFTLLHIYANYKAVKSVSIEIFNLTRFAIFVDNYLKNKIEFNIKQINSEENVWFFIKDKFDIYSDRIKIGVPLQNHFSNALELNELIDIYSDDGKCRYILSSDHKNQIHISLSKESNCLTLIEAVFQAIVICLAEKSEQKIDPQFRQSLNQIIIDSNVSKNSLELSRKFSKQWIKDIKQTAQTNGWDLSKVLIISNEWRFDVINDFIDINKSKN